MSVGLGHPIDICVFQVVQMSEAQEDAFFVNVRLQRLHGLTKEEGQLSTRHSDGGTNARTSPDFGLSLSLKAEYCVGSKIMRKPSMSDQVEYLLLKRL